MTEATSAGLVVEERTAQPRENRLLAATRWVLETASMVLMAALAALVFVNAASRYALSRPLPWTEEVVINLLVWLAALGIVMAAMRGALICCDVITDRLSAPNQKLLRRFCALLGAAVMLYCAWLTWRYLKFFGGDLSPVIGIPKGVVIAGVLVALIGIAATLVAAFFRR